ncbi:hypothetical protein ACIB24_11695 [Spongisporangium articulatum]|uniref:Membrane protein YqaA, SNARE-associated domain n=1 Tax=Spongisporangium articulatum TaxID=3362603 RepID=A0ABW8AN02_9ACTN
MDSAAFAVLTGSLGFGVASAILVILNAEAYLIAVAETTSLWVGWGAVVAVSVGQMIGKIILFVSVRQGSQSKWLRRWREKHAGDLERARADGVPAPPPGGPTATAVAVRPVEQTRWQRFKAWTVRWGTLGLGQLDHPVRAAGLVLFSAAVGVPPLAVVTIAAGARRTSLPVFAVCALVGRLVRFGVIAAPFIWHHNR